jgi:hypothetical protein
VLGARTRCRIVQARRLLEAVARSGLRIESEMGRAHEHDRFRALKRGILRDAPIMVDRRPRLGMRGCLHGFSHAWPQPVAVQ